MYTYKSGKVTIRKSEIQTIRLALRIQFPFVGEFFPGLLFRLFDATEDSIRAVGYWCVKNILSQSNSHQRADEQHYQQCKDTIIASNGRCHDIVLPGGANLLL
jgi:hypothetical protein